jgi:hypothetical protein
MVGDARSFRAVDKNGHILHDVQWTASDPAVLELTSGDEVEVTAKQAGKCTLIAHASEGFAEVQVEVVSGTKMQPGTVMWSAPAQPGCKPIQIIQAVPTANGPDLYETSACPDGTYIRAFTADGIMLWRRRLESTRGASSPLSPAKSVTALPAASINTRAVSICDSISDGMKKEVVQELLKGHKLSSGDPSLNLWVVDQEGAQCKLWFNADSQVIKKRKVLTTE